MMSMPAYRIRLYVLTATVLVGMGVLLTRLYEFQIERRTEFLGKVPGNRTITVREPGIRGEITDRNGVVLARNLRKYEISFNLEEIRQAWLRHHAGDPDAARKSRDIVAILKDGPDSVIARLQELGLAADFRAGDLRTHYVTHGGLIPYSYRRDLDYEDFARVAERSLELPGVYLTIRPQREYPYGALASHVLGYLKQWEKGDVPEDATRRFTHYIGDERGIAGIESSMDAVLRGPEGRKTIIRDEKGRDIRMTDYVKPGVGARLELTIDARRQLLLENVLRRTGRAAGVVMDARTGEVLAMASVPDYDPNAFIPSIDEAKWKAYRSNRRLSPFTNRAITAFTPGSTMKVAAAVAGALQGMGTRRFSCDGYVSYGSHRVGCWIWNQSKGSHGQLDVAHALQHSCNPYFNKLANAIGWRAMVDGCAMLGFGRRTGIELPREDPGILPGSASWRQSNPGAMMSPVQTAFLSIGQGDTMATPLQLCALAACVANGGDYHRPRIVRRAVAENGTVLIEDKPQVTADLVEAGIRPVVFEQIRRGMWLAVNEGGGTGGKARVPGVEVAAKTGTAQTSDAGQKSNNSWMISFAPYKSPRYAICVMVQNAGSGGGVCGPLVHLIYRGLFALDEGQGLPLRPQTEFAGNLKRIESVELPRDVLAAIEVGQPDAGETGEEVGELRFPRALPVDESVMPEPTLTPVVDEEGTLIPRARPVGEPADAAPRRRGG
ncbi:MAG: hypothetical protein FJ385_03265 [Verrucomicrobia bacterium]|nr:hypothetical protein [Verrucomicrobiota bacterium]